MLTLLGTLGYLWAPQGTYRVPLRGANLGTIKANFFVFWPISKFLKPTTISDEYTNFFVTKLTHWALLTTSRNPYLYLFRVEYLNSGLA